jgi:hypothetical protein
MQILRTSFERKETYLHLKAKEVLKEWWNTEYYFGIVPLRIDLESAMSMNGVVCFVPDLLIYDLTGIKVFVEIKYKNPVDNYKMWKMLMWSYQHKINPLIIQIDAEWIMKRLNPPKELICEILYDDRFNLKML